MEKIKPKWKIDVRCQRLFRNNIAPLENEDDIENSRSEKNVRKMLFSMGA